MDVENGIATICPDNHGRGGAVLARAEGSLARCEAALWTGMSHGGVGRALNNVVAAGLVWRARLPAYVHYHVLHREHLTADLVLALAWLNRLLARRVADRAAARQPPAETVAPRLPFPQPPEEVGPARPAPTSPSTAWRPR